MELKVYEIPLKLYGKTDFANGFPRSGADLRSAADAEEWI
jgi:hypothetical protein